MNLKGRADVRKAAPTDAAESVMGFLALDFELANSRPESACAVGAAVFDDEGGVHIYKSLIRPPEDFGGFQAYNTMLHGIDPALIQEARPFPLVWRELEPLFADQLLVAHNAVLDTDVLQTLLSRSGLCFEGCDFLCTLEVAKKVWPTMPNHKLDTLCYYLQIPLEHHRPESDAAACGYLALAAMFTVGVSEPRELADSLNVKFGHIAGTVRPSAG